MRSPALLSGGLALVATAFSLPAQCGDPNLGASLTGATYNDDVVLAGAPLGFPFPFGGATYTDVHISTNGLVYLSNAGTPAPGGSGCCNGVVATMAAGSPMIAAYWNDLVTDPAVGGEVMFNATAGRAVITWLNSREYGEPTLQPFSFQLQLLASGEIFLTYDGRCQIRNGGDFVVGMSPGGGATVPAATDLSITSPSVSDTMFEVFTTNGSFDLADQAVQFVPTLPGYANIPLACPTGAHERLGIGCYQATNSFYQLTASPAASSAALSNTAITMAPTGTGYTVFAGGAYVPPTPAATILALPLDDSSIATPLLTTPFPYTGGTATEFTVCSNGSVWVAGGNSVGYAPDVDVMLNGNAQTAWYAWHDYNPTIAASGKVKFEEIGTTVYITWDGVYNYGGSSPSDATQMQFQFDCASGLVTIAFGTVSANAHTGFVTGEPHLIGYSPGGASIDPGSAVFATDLPLTTADPELLAMSLTASPNPTLGGAFTYTADEVTEYAPASGVYLATLFLSATPLPAGFDLGIIGAPGCEAYIASIDVDLGAQVGLVPSMSWNVTLPTSLFAIGNTFTAQAVALVVPNSLPGGQNAFGMTVSNGLLSTVGAW